MNARAFKPLPLCSAPLKNLVVGITGALGMKESSRNERNPLSKQNIFSENSSRRALRNKSTENKTLPLCSAPLKNLVVRITGATRDFWSSRMKESEC